MDPQDIGIDLSDYEASPTIAPEHADAIASLFGDNAAPEAASPSPWSGSFAPSAEPLPSPAPGPDAVSAPTASWSGSFMPDRPYAVPTMAEGRAGNLAAAGLGTVASLFGVGSGSASPDTAGGAYRDDWERRNPGRNFADTVIDYRGSGIDTSGMQNGGLPVMRVNSITGKQLAAEPVSNWNDLRSISGSVPMRDKNGEVLTDAEGRTRRYDLPGWNGQQRFEGGLTPTTLENGQQVYYDKFNNLTYGVGKDGQPDRLLPGGMGYQGGASGGAYGFIPTTDKQGRPVFYDEQGNRTFLRNGDTIGANVANLPRGGSGAGGSGGGWDGVYRNLGPAIAPMATITGQNIHQYQNYTLVETKPGVFDVYTPNGQLVESAVPQRRLSPNDSSYRPDLAGNSGGVGGGGNGERLGKKITIDNAGYVVVNPQGSRVNVPPGSVAQAVTGANGQPIGTYVREPNGSEYVLSPNGQRRTFDTAPVTPQNGNGGPAAVTPPPGNMVPTAPIVTVHGNGPAFDRPPGYVPVTTVPTGPSNAPLGANGEPLPAPSLLERAGGVARDDANRIISAGGSLAIGANDQLNRGKAANSLVWDAATQSWRTQAEMAAEAARRGAGSAARGASDFARGFVGR